MIYNLVTAASSLPVSLADGKSHLRVTHSSHDDLITALLWGSIREFENYTNTCLSLQTWDLVLNQAEVTDRIVWYKYPVYSISEVQYYDGDNASQTTTDYVSFLSGRPASIRFDCDSDETPTTYDRDDSMTIRFLAGYTAAGSNSVSAFPTDIEQAILARVYRLYENPDDPVSERMTYFDKVLKSYRGYDL